MTLYHVTHPNGSVFVMEADTPEEAAEQVVDELHPEVACKPKELTVEIAEEEE